MPSFIPWPEIALFHNIKKYIQVDPADWWKNKVASSDSSTVTYRGKIKLHGSNAAVQYHLDGSIVCQSRERVITPEDDNAGFARWVMNNKEAWIKANTTSCYVGGKEAYRGMIYYGEWAGSGVQKGVAVSEIGKKIFAIFAARPLKADGSADDELIVDPSVLELFVQGIPDVYVLPWYTRADGNTNLLDIDWSKSDEELTKVIAPVNDWITEIEANDPWVEKTFGVKGTGEGLVFYPYDGHHRGYDNFSNLCFKAKGEKHKTVATAKAVQVSAEAAANVDAFVAMVVTEARLEQGVTKVSPDGSLSFDMKLTGKFVTWVNTDVEKECQDELAISNLTWKQVQKPVSDKARTWYLGKAKSV